MKRRILVVLGLLAICLTARWAAVFRANAQADRVASVNGDTNGDGARDLSDAVFLLNWLFVGGPEPVAIAGSPDLEARLLELENQVARLSADGPGRSPLELALESLRRLGGDHSADVWNQPTWKFHDTSNAGATHGRASLFLDGSPAPGRVIGFSAVEGLSELTRFEVIEEIPAADYKPMAPGVAATLAYTDAAGRAFFHGEVIEVALAGSSDTSVFVTVRCFSKLHRLTRGRKSKTYQDQSDQDIVSAVLSSSGILSSDTEFLLEDARIQHDHIYQHNQTDLEFLSRLMEEEGIYFFEVQTDAGARIRFGDGQSGLIPPVGEPLTHLDHLAPPPDRPGAHAFDLRIARSRPLASVTVGEYDPLKAGPLFAAAVNPGGAGDDYRFGVGVYDPPELDALAERELELSQASAESIECETNSASLRPGSGFAIQGANARFNGKYYVTGVTHRYATHDGPSGFTSYFGNTVRGLPERVRFRPPHAAPAPACTGVHSAFVTGPPGQKTYTDALGRVKVRFPWIRDGVTNENASAWVRVAQNGIGLGAQGYFLPEIGDEVLVAFEHGDINRPVVVGSLWNGVDKPPR